MFVFKHLTQGYEHRRKDQQVVCTRRLLILSSWQYCSCLSSLFRCSALRNEAASFLLRLPLCATVPNSFIYVCAYDMCLCMRCKVHAYINQHVSELDFDITSLHAAQNVHTKRASSGWGLQGWHRQCRLFAQMATLTQRRKPKKPKHKGSRRHNAALQAACPCKARLGRPRQTWFRAEGRTSPRPAHFCCIPPASRCTGTSEALIQMYSIITICITIEIAL